jgi:hypothetical protein
MSERKERKKEKKKKTNRQGCELQLFSVTTQRIATGKMKKKRRKEHRAPKKNTYRTLEQARIGCPYRSDRSNCC